jgi:hypothetical protein
MKLQPHGTDYATEAEALEAFDNDDTFLASGPRGDMLVNRTMLIRDFGYGWYFHIVYANLTMIVRVEL